MFQALYSGRKPALRAFRDPGRGGGQRGGPGGPGDLEHVRGGAEHGGARAAAPAGYVRTPEQDLLILTLAGRSCITTNLILVVGGYGVLAPLKLVARGASHLSATRSERLG